MKESKHTNAQAGQTQVVNVLQLSFKCGSELPGSGREKRPNLLGMFILGKQSCSQDFVRDEISYDRGSVV